MSGKQFLYIVLTTFVTIIIWVVSNMIYANQKVEVEPEIEQLLAPISPDFDQEVINGL